MRLRKTQCNNCPFLPDGVKLGQRKMEEICRYLVAGENHICHYTSDSVCKGGRDFQLNLWFELGMITSPTNEALANEMESLGIEPKQHICND